LRGGGRMERVKEGKYGQCILYACMENKTMKHPEIIFK
jgi:hypothetical protein